MDLKGKSDREALSVGIAPAVWDAFKNQLALSRWILVGLDLSIFYWHKVHKELDYEL